jgi:hypothetical protein
MRLFEVLNAEGVQARGETMRDEWIFAICSGCGEEVCLAQVRITTEGVQTLYICPAGCEAPVVTVNNDSSGIYSAPGGMRFGIPEPPRDDFALGMPQSFS